jgi:hypothetical protein
MKTLTEHDFFDMRRQRDEERTKGIEVSARIASLEAAILNIGQKIDHETYANVKAAILDAVKLAKGN